MKPFTRDIFQFESRRFKIRPLTPEDASESYLAWWNDPRVQTGMNKPARGWDLKRARKHIASFDNRTSFHLGIFSRESGDLVGAGALFFHKVHNVVLLNILIGDKRFWGRRVMQELEPRLLSILFEDIGVEKVKAEIHGQNRASMFLCESMGFSREGVLRNEVSNFEGGRIDVTIYGLLREEWKARST